MSGLAIATGRGSRRLTALRPLSADVEPPIRAWRAGVTRLPGPVIGVSVSHVQELTLHLGLPKTATTTLQKHVFPRFPGYLGIHAGDGLPSSSEWAAWKMAFDGWGTWDPEWRDALRAYVATIEHAGHSQVLLSQESLSRWPADGASSSWPVDDDWSSVERARPHPVIEFLRTIKECAGEMMHLRIILTLRNQPDLMGSLYAQLQARMFNPCQADLEAKIAHLLRSDDPFFDFAALVDELEAELGADDCLFLLYEDGLECNVSRIEAFLRTTFSCSPSTVARENVKRLGSQSWKGGTLSRPVTQRGRLGTARMFITGHWPRSLLGLKRRIAWALARMDIMVVRVVPSLVREGVVVAMTDELALSIRQHFAASNARLGHRLGRELEPLGY